MQNPEVLSRILKDAKVQVFGTIEEQTNRLIELRDKCDERGYHRAGGEPEDGESMMICYDCDLWFTKDFAESCDLKYKVVPI